MVQKYDFTGSYLRKGSTFNKDSITLAIATRKNFTPQKPREFIIFRTPEKPKGDFWSSIYKASENVYRADYNKQEYILTFTNEGLKIEAA